MKLAAVTTIAICLVCSIAGCSNAPDTTRTTDCALLIRAAGETFVEVGFTTHRGPEIGDVEVSSCDDSGKVPGPTFPGSPKTTPAFRVKGWNPSQVLAVDVGDGSTRVFARDDLPAATLEELRSQFTLP